MISDSAPTPPTTPTPVTSTGLSYGNIYTPHAGSMIIQVQRESGLQSRTIVLGPRQVRILNLLTSRAGKILVACLCAVAVALVIEAVRVPGLTHQISRMQHTAQRLDSLERSLTEVQKRYDQVRTMMGIENSGIAARGAGAAPAGAATAFTPAGARPASTGSPSNTASATGAGSSAANVDAAASSTINGSGAGEPAALDPSAPTAAPARHSRRARRAKAPAVPAEAAPAEAAPAEAAPVVPDSGVAPSPQAEPQ